MDFAMDVAAMAMSMKSAALQQNYSLAMQKAVMNDMERSGQELLDMMPAEAPVQIPKGEVLDVFA